LAGVLIIAREDVVAALLGLMAELEGWQPRFPQKDGSLADAIGREPMDVVLIDCEHPQYDGDLIEVARSSGAVPILFGPFRMKVELSEDAARSGTKWFTLPTDSDSFGKMLGT